MRAGPVCAGRQHRAASTAARATALAVALLLSACAASDRVILLPGAPGRPTGGLVVSAVGAPAGAPALVLNQAYSQAEVKRGQTAALPATSAAQVQAEFGSLLQAVPERARHWTLYFQSGGGDLTPESALELQALLAAASAYAVGDLVVTGHTDRVGPELDNDRLSLVRATAVRERLAAAGVALQRISVVGRGEREPLISTPDETPEARNRRVEIKLR